MPRVGLYFIARSCPPQGAVQAPDLLGVLGPASKTSAVLQQDVPSEAFEGPVEVVVRAGQEEVVAVHKAEGVPLGGAKSTWHWLSPARTPP